MTDKVERELTGWAIDAARTVVGWDWSDNDEDCVRDMETLRQAVEAWDRRFGPLVIPRSGPSAGDGCGSTKETPWGIARCEYEFSHAGWHRASDVTWPWTSLELRAAAAAQESRGGAERDH